MSRFEFMHRASGDVIEREYRVGRAPRSVRVGGRRFERIPSAPVMHFADQVNGRETSFLGQSIDPAHHKYHRGRFHRNEHGERLPVFSSAREREAFKSAAARDGIRYEYGKHRGESG